MTTLKNVSFVISVVVLLFTLGACRKSNEYAINGDLMKYFDYKVGTYWIMRDSISGRVDSFFVASNQFYSTFNSVRADDIGIQILEYTSGNINSDSTSWQINLVSNDFYFDIQSPKFIYITNSEPLFGYPFAEFPPEENILPSLTLYGKTYSSVAEIIQNAYGYDDWFYINTDAGFVKIRLNHPSANENYVWELQRKYIVH